MPKVIDGRHFALVAHSHDYLLGGRRLTVKRPMFKTYPALGEFQSLRGLYASITDNETSDPWLFFDERAIAELSLHSVSPDGEDTIRFAHDNLEVFAQIVDSLNDMVLSQWAGNRAEVAYRECAQSMSSPGSTKGRVYHFRVRGFEVVDVAGPAAD